MWDGVQLGRSASVACYSSQSAKVINSGEGGFFMTDDDELAARAACYAGCYEQLYLQHVVAPPAAVFDRVKFETPMVDVPADDRPGSRRGGGGEEAGGVRRRDQAAEGEGDPRGGGLVQ